MREVKDLYSAQAANLWETVAGGGGVVGFRIPEYQRTYDWGKDKIDRLLEDCANGLYQLSQPTSGNAYPSESFTFLGTLILVKEKAEATFDGKSWDVVDGQQRLTTLMLVCCALMEEISANLAAAETLSEEASRWVIAESDARRGELLRCIVGEIPGISTPGRFPRIIRQHEDNRAESARYADEKSIVAKFLMEFAKSYRSGGGAFEFDDLIGNEGRAKRFGDNYRHIRSQITRIADLSSSSSDADLNYEIVPSHRFNVAGFTSLLPKLDRMDDQRQKDKINSEISRRGACNGLIRLLLLSSYVCRCVVLTRVETDDDGAAFDIFDALNSTGDPLTAIETFRPRAIRAEDEQDGYKGSDCEAAFKQIEKVLGAFVNSDQRQREAKEIIVTFALYDTGEKVSGDLRVQRSHLRKHFDKIVTIQDRRCFVRALADVAQFRSECWDRKGIDNATYLSDDAKLCLRVIRDMNTSLALPILARYWSQRAEFGLDPAFESAVKAVTAFLVLRRTVTGSTGGIDAVFRKIMSQASPEGDAALCRRESANSNNGLPSVERLKCRLKSLLEDDPINATTREQWVENTEEVPIANHTRALAKFLIFAAAQFALPKEGSPGLLRQARVVPSTERKYLTYENWTAPHYSTVEHVAPDSDPGDGWDRGIYRKQHTRHTIGNLVLLPQKVNESASNRPWRQKKLFYLALSEQDSQGRTERFSQAQNEGIHFSAKTKKIIKNQERLHLLDSIREVEDWDEELIRARSRNVLQLAWDTLAPWLS